MSALGVITVFSCARGVVAELDRKHHPEVGEVRRVLRVCSYNARVLPVAQEYSITAHFETPWLNGAWKRVSEIVDWRSGFGWLGRTRRVRFCVPIEQLADNSSVVHVRADPVHPLFASIRWCADRWHVVFKYDHHLEPAHHPAGSRPILPCVCGGSWVGPLHCVECRPAHTIIFNFDPESLEEECHD